MVRVKLDQETMGLASVAEQMTRAHVKDCFKEDTVIYFIAAEGDLGKMIGKGGSMIRKLQDRFKKPIRVVEYNADVTRFVQNLIYPVKVAAVVEEDGVVVIRDENRSTKGKIIGRSGSNLALLSRIVKRFFDIELKVE